MANHHNSPPSWPTPPPNTEGAFQRALAGLMGLVGRDVIVELSDLDYVASISTSGYLTVPPCPQCEGGQEIESVVRFRLDVEHGGESAGYLILHSGGIADVTVHDCECLLMCTEMGWLEISRIDCPHRADDLDV